MYDTLIHVEALAALGPDVALFDCRTDLSDPAGGRRAFLAGHIPGAVHLHLEDDLSGAPDEANGRHPLPDREAFAARLRAFGVQRGMQVVAYDDAGGSIAGRAWWMLRWLGHRAAAVLDGGLQAWTGAGRPLETGPARARAAGDIEAGAPLVGIANTSEIEAAIGRSELLVIDARSEARFAGEPHPLDTASGHIPGARNRFYQRNLGADGRFKGAVALAAEFRAVLAGTPPERAVLQCGSGVTACHDLLAMEVAGLSGARLYPGSWSAWTSDPARPIETGG